MTQIPDTMNCLKNLMQLMCCDGSVHPAEKRFLAKAAKALDIQVDNWNGLLKEVLNDDIPLYPVNNRDRAIAALKSLIVMSKADGQVDAKEKALTLQFAKSIGVNRNEWKEIISNINPETLFEPFRKTAGRVLAIRDDFEKLDNFLSVAAENGVQTETADMQAFVQSPHDAERVVCFHAAEDKDVTVTRCQMLLDKCGDKLVCILTRFQGHQVKYLLEIGLKKCIIEPIYTRDITNLFKK